jgi:predicted ester cyclase
MPKRGTSGGSTLANARIVENKGVSMTENENIQIAHQQIAALNAHDIDLYVQRIDHSYVGESETHPGPIHGPEGARQVLTMTLTAFPDLRVEVEHILASGDQLVIQTRLSGTHKGILAGIAPTNKHVSWQGCNVVTLRNGKAIRSRIYADNLSLMGQLGVLPQPKATTA